MSKLIDFHLNLLTQLGGLLAPYLYLKFFFLTQPTYLPDFQVSINVLLTGRMKTLRTASTKISFIPRKLVDIQKIFTSKTLLLLSVTTQYGMQALSDLILFGRGLTKMVLINHNRVNYEFINNCDFNKLIFSNNNVCSQNHLSILYFRFTVKKYLLHHWSYICGHLTSSFHPKIFFGSYFAFIWKDLTFLVWTSVPVQSATAARNFTILTNHKPSICKSTTHQSSAHHHHLLPVWKCYIPQFFFSFFQNFSHFFSNFDLEVLLVSDYWFIFIYKISLISTKISQKDSAFFNDSHLNVNRKKETVKCEIRENVNQSELQEFGMVHLIR